MLATIAFRERISIRAKNTPRNFRESGWNNLARLFTHSPTRKFLTESLPLQISSEEQPTRSSWPTTRTTPRSSPARDCLFLIGGLSAFSARPRLSIRPTWRRSVPSSVALVRPWAYGNSFTDPPQDLQLRLGPERAEPNQASQLHTHRGRVLWTGDGKLTARPPNILEN